MCYELFVAAAVWLATLWACGYLPRLVSFFNMPASTSNRALLFTRLDSNRALLFTRLDSNRALLLTGIGADAHEGAGYRGHRPSQQLQLGLRTCHVGRVAALGSVPEDTGTLVSWDTLRPSTLL